MEVVVAGLLFAICIKIPRERVTLNRSIEEFLEEQDNESRSNPENRYTKNILLYHLNDL